MNTHFANCDRCGKAILYGNAFVSISRYVEQIEFSIARNRIETQPIDAVTIITICAACGNVFDETTFRKILKNSLLTDQC